MRSVIRKLRGLVGLGVFSAGAWALVGVLLGSLVLLIDPASVDIGEGPLWAAYYFGRAGFVAGIAAGAIIAFAERRRSLSSVRLPRVAAWGAAAGLALPWLAVAPQAMLPFFVILGAATATAALVLARRGERRALETICNSS